MNFKNRIPAKQEITNANQISRFTILTLTFYLPVSSIVFQFISEGSGASDTKSMTSS
jgi:hypothetical protein